MASSLRESALRGLMWARVYPHIGFTYSPFKILEFRELMSGVSWRGDERVLDIGCGAGLQTMLIAGRAGHTTGLDIDPRFVADARRRAKYFRGPGRVDFEDRHLHEVGYPDATFDHVFSICVLEHIPEHEAILAECLRILKPGGGMHFSVDSLENLRDPELVASHARQHHVVQYYREDTLRELLERLGFVDVTLRPVFRSELARSLFTEGIRRGFNFGRVRTQKLVRQLGKAEVAHGDTGPGLFLIARSKKRRSR